MTATTLRRKKDKMYAIAPSGDDYYAFWSDGRAGLYIDGTFVSYRPGGSGGGPAIPEAPSLIHTDSEAIVGPGSIAFRVDSTHLSVWDVDGAATYDYAVPAGYVTTPTVAAALMGRSRFANTDTPLWDGNILDGTMAGFRAMASKQMTASHLLFGSFEEVVIGEWGVLELAMNPYQSFNAGVVGIRAIYTVDVLTRYPQAFVLSTAAS